MGAGTVQPKNQSSAPWRFQLTPALFDSEVLAAKIQRSLLQQVASLLKFSADALDPDTELAEFGFDSITLTDFANRLNAAYRLELTPAVFFEFSTLRRFADYLATHHAAAMASVLGIEVAPAPVASVTGSAPAETKHESVPLCAAVTAPASAVNVAEPIAIIGVSGSFPLAEDLAAFWRNLHENRDCIREIPPDRWDWRAIYGDPEREPNKTNIKVGRLHRRGRRF